MIRSASRRYQGNFDVRKRLDLFAHTLRPQFRQRIQSVACHGVVVELGEGDCGGVGMA